jgi:hypothetical protein
MDLGIIKKIMKLIPDDDKELDKKDNDGLKNIILQIKKLLGPLLTAGNIKKGISMFSKFFKKK